MVAKFSKTAVACAIGVFVLAATIVTPAHAVPQPFGACCSIQGCCAAPPSLVQPTGVPRGGVGSCIETTFADCLGLGVVYIGEGTTCEAQCMATTTTTLLPFGACCLAEGGCSELSSKECDFVGSFQGDATVCDFVECSIPTTTTTLPPTGACCLSGGGCDVMTATQCDGVGGFYTSDGYPCESTKCVSLTTTTTLAPFGPCCLFGGGCNDLTPKECDGVGEYVGDGFECMFTKCALPTTTTTTVTTTTLLVTTTTTIEASICGDANMDGDITAPDALIALKTAVGSGACSFQRCDYNGDGDVSASDALAILKKAVGQPVVPMCPLP